ncbi:MAG TPA: TlpA disulfide reductase family protein [Candidatus Acidoferrales bacterium]|nr:TlpA disulfide reductase family protein [Candidatus Acidoferrales bacterium]
MAALTPGTPAPTISLKDSAGKSTTLAEQLKKGPVLAAFFKVSCPTCQFTAPFLERLHEMYGGPGFTLLGISQDEARHTREFMSEFGLKFPVLIDDCGYPASNQYGLTNVPTVFLIAPDGNIQMSAVGFSKPDLEDVAVAAARSTGKATTPLFKPGEVIPDYKPG